MIKDSKETNDKQHHPTIIVTTVDMLCESRLWQRIICPKSECIDFTCHSVTAQKTSSAITNQSTQIQVPIQCSPSNTFQELQSQHSDCQPRPGASLDYQNLSPGVGIPAQVPPLETEAFLVPPSCHSICQHYNDLYIAGGQVLPLKPEIGSLHDQPPGPFLLSKDVPPPSLLRPLPTEHRSSRRWRVGSMRERLSLIQDGRPLSNSELNGYLEQKLLELYTEYITEGPIMESELEQIPLQLSREHKLETGQVKDILLSCILRATSSQQSSEISTPLLQISTQTK